ESYEIESDKSEMIEIIIGDKSWKLSELKTGLMNLGTDLSDETIKEIWKIGIKLMVEIEIIITWEFLRKFYEIELLSDERRESEIKEWLDNETIKCEGCNNRKLGYIISEENEICNKCIEEMETNERNELLEL